MQISALVILALAVLPIGDASAQELFPLRVEDVSLAVKQPEWTDGRVRFQPDRAAYERLFRAGSARVIQFPLPTGDWVDLELVSASLLNRDTRFFVRDGEGIRESFGPSMRFFRGRVVGDAGSLVSLNLFQGRIAGFVRTGQKEYTFAPLYPAGDGDFTHEIEIRNDADETGPVGRCDGHGELPGGLIPGPADARSTQAGALAMESSIDGNTLLLAHVAVEGTVEWVNKHGGVAGAEAYTLNLMAQVSAIYESDLKVQIQVPYVLMNTAEPDGYSGETHSTATILPELRAKWNGDETLRNVFRTVVHLFGTYPGGGSGRAWVDVLCDGLPASENSYDFGVSLLAGDGQSWERGLVAHELGHNFSSRHTHCYDPEIDLCYSGESGCFSGTEVQTTGTIMSYCDTTVQTFHQRVREEKLRPAAEAAFPACLDVAGMPGDLRAQDGNGLAVAAANLCAPAYLVDDDSYANGSYGYSGTARAAWMKRFTPSCYPFKLTDVEVRISNGSVAPGRGLRILVYKDAAGSGNPINAALVQSEDTVVQVVSSSDWNQYALSEPVILTSGDFYLGFYDLVADEPTTYIMSYDSGHNGDSWWQSNGTAPGGYGSFSGGSWMIRGRGGGVAAHSLVLSWGNPCNAASVPGQDYAVYEGTMGEWDELSSLTCSTGHAGSWLIESQEDFVFWLVVPQNSANEGSYGQSSFGERLPAAVPCKPQAVGVCP